MAAPLSLASGQAAQAWHLALVIVLCCQVKLLLGELLGACSVVGSWVPIQNLEVFSLKGGGGMVERVSVTPFLHLFSAEFLWFPLMLLPGWCVLKLPHQFSCMILLPSEQGAPFESGVKVTIFIRISYFPTYSSRNSKQHGNFMPLTHLH